MTTRAEAATGGETAPGAAPRVVAVVFNPTKVERGEIEPAIASDPRSSSWAQPMWLETTEEDPGQGAAQRAVDAGAALVVAAGGDGTVRAVAETLRGTGVPLALLPSGTGNLLARNLELDVDDLSGSIHTALAGVDRTIDIGVIELTRQDGSVDTRSFLVMAGLGIDAKMAENTDETLKKRVGWLAYVDSITRAMRDKSQLRLRYALDEGTERPLNAHTLIVGNCGKLPGNLLLMPEAQVDDGLFDIVFLRPKGFLGWLQIWARVAWEDGIIRRTHVGRKLMGEKKQIRALEYERAATITATFARPKAIELDGDAFGETVAIKSWIDPLALTVRMPADQPSQK